MKLHLMDLIPYLWVPVNLFLVLHTPEHFRNINRLQMALVVWAIFSRSYFHLGFWQVTSSVTRLVIKKLHYTFVVLVREPFGRKAAVLQVNDQETTNQYGSVVLSTRH